MICNLTRCLLAQALRHPFNNTNGCLLKNNIDLKTTYLFLKTLFFCHIQCLLCVWHYVLISEYNLHLRLYFIHPQPTRTQTVSFPNITQNKMQSVDVSDDLQDLNKINLIKNSPALRHIVELPCKFHNCSIYWLSDICKKFGLTT